MMPHNSMYSLATTALVAATFWLSSDMTMGQDAPKVLFVEDFEELELGPVVQEQEPDPGGFFDPEQVWTNVPPEGWTRREDPEMPGLDDEFVGVEEFEGWTFVNAVWWTETAGDQRRSTFSFENETTVAVADPDEWDDIGSPTQQGKFNAWLSTPPINITGAQENTVGIGFESSWRDEAFDDGDRTNNQTATLTVSFDGGNPIEVLRWESDPSSPDFKDDAPFEEVSLSLNNPAGATGMVVEFGVINAGNDWWWAVDNIEISGVGGIGGVLGVTPRLQAGDADMDLDFDQLDLVKVQIAGKYLTGQAATWGEGDWNGAPGGFQGDPPPGNGRFDQLDIIAALNAGKYLTGPYAAIRPNGQADDGQTSIVYDAVTGEIAVDAPAGTELTSINIDSAAGIFTGNAAENLGGSFDNDADNNIFKATFGSSFGSLSFGNVAQPGVPEEFLLNDLTVVGSLAGGGDLGDVDLIYIPEPSTLVLLSMGAFAITFGSWRRRRVM